MHSGRLAELRESKKLTLNSVAKATGIPEPQLSRYETGKVVPTIERLVSLARFYSTSVDYLVGTIDPDTEKMQKVLIQDYSAVPSPKRGDFVAIVHQVSKALCS